MLPINIKRSRAFGQWRSTHSYRVSNISENFSHHLTTIFLDIGAVSKYWISSHLNGFKERPPNSSPRIFQHSLISRPLRHVLKHPFTIDNFGPVILGELGPWEVGEHFERRLEGDRFEFQVVVGRRSVVEDGDGLVESSDWGGTLPLAR